MLRDQEIIQKKVLVGLDEQFFMPDKVSVQRTMLELTVAAQRVNFGMFQFAVFVCADDLVVPVNNVAALTGWQLSYGIMCATGVKDERHDDTMQAYRNMDLVCAPVFSSFYNLTYLHPVVLRTPFLDALIHFSREENMVDYDRKSFINHASTIRK